jgi:hypothetical protein
MLPQKINADPLPILLATTRSDQLARCRQYHSLCKLPDKGDDGWTDGCWRFLDRECYSRLVTCHCLITLIEEAYGKGGIVKNFPCLQKPPGEAAAAAGIWCEEGMPGIL